MDFKFRNTELDISCEIGFIFFILSNWKPLEAEVIETIMEQLKVVE